MVEEGEERSSGGTASPQSSHEQPLTTVEQRDQQNQQVSLNDGPFQSVPLIKNLPTGIEYVQCEALEQNVYLGTSTGDLLHYYEIEPQNYMLVSQTKFNADLSDPIDKIILLPNIERALVLSNQTLVLFLLPEFAPVPNTPNLSGIADIALRGYSKTSGCYKFYAAQKDSIKLLKASSNVITLSKKYEFELVSKLIAQGHHLAVAKQNNYEILDVKSSRVIPLFRVSEINAPLRPVVIEFKKQEFLVATGGGSYDDSSMALVVNYNGDIVNATIVLDKYPSDVIVEYPYLIVSFKPDQVFIYRLDDEPTVIQKIKAQNLRIAKTSKTFSGFRRPEILERVVEMIRKVPLVNSANQLKIENEQALAAEIFEEESTIVMYGTFGMNVLIKPSALLDFTEHNESGMRAIQSYLEESEGLYQSKFKQLENHYLHTLMLLLELLHCKAIDLALIKKWCSALNIVDVRLFLYVLGFQVYGSLWIFNGLVDLIERLKSLKLYHKCDDLGWLLQSISALVDDKKTKDATWDYPSTVKTLDVNIFKIKVEKNEDEIDISVFHEDSLEQILHVVEANQSIGLDIRLQVMRRNGMLEESIELLKRKGETKRLLNLLKENADELPPSYHSHLIDDVLFVIEKTKQLDKNLISEIIQLLSFLNADPRQLLKRVDKNAAVKVLIIQELGPKDSNDRQFLLDYYIAKLQESLQKDDIQITLKGFVEEYSGDMSYSKCSVKEFFIIKLKGSERLRCLLEYCETLEALCEQEVGISLTKSLVKALEKLDTSHVLTVLFLPEGKVARELLTEDQLLDIFITFNDFTSIEKYLEKDNIIRILKHYGSLGKRRHSLTLVTGLLERNVNLIQGEAIIISILEKLPTEYNLDALHGSLFPILKNIDSESKQLELKKALLKNQISAYDHFLNTSNSTG